MKIGILYICAGEYDIFWKDFYISCEKYFLKKHEKHYFVFTDSKYIFNEDKNKNIHKIYQKDLGWPNITLMRFHFFLSQKNKIKNMDYLFFFNANLKIKKEILENILPKEEGLLVTQHPGFFNKKNIKFPYERNKKSMAYIRKGKGKVYVQGALNGGKSNIFLNMCEKLSKKIDIDKKNGIFAIWYDESHLNRYILNNNYKLLDPSYLYPEGLDIPFDCKILIRNKAKIINVNKIKGFKENILNKMIIKIKGLLKK